MLKGKRQVVYVMLITAIFFYSCEKEVSSNLLDIDGNEYKTITIGKQVWMAENLKVTHFRDGTAITNVTDNAAWAALTTEAYCIYKNKTSNEYLSATLYNWYAVTNEHNLAPEGWHVPTDTEWTELETYLSNNGHNGTEGTALKSTTDWGFNTDGTDDYGFTAVAGGRRTSSGGYDYRSTSGFFWSPPEYGSYGAWYRYRKLDKHSSDIHRGAGSKRSGFAVRLLRD